MRPRIDPREVAAALLPGAALAALAALGLGVLALTLDDAERATLAALLAPRAALLFAGWLPLALAAGVLVHRARRHFIIAPARLGEEAQAAVAGDGSHALPPQGGAGMRALADAVNDLLRQRAALRDRMAERVREASRDIEQERSRLATLMSQLPQAVVVCNLDGRILLYNQRARWQFRALSDAPALAGGGELIGLGRSIYAVLDRQIVAHALESVQQRQQRGVPTPSAQLVMHSRGGQLLRVQLAPVRAIVAGEGGAGMFAEAGTHAGAVAEAQARAGEESAGAAAPAADAGTVADAAAAASRTPTAVDTAALNGFVLLLDNITRDYADETLRDRLLQELTEGSRASLGNLQAAVEMLDYEDLDAPTRERFLRIVRDEVRTMAGRIHRLDEHTVQAQKTRWPLEDMLGADLCAAALRRIAAAHPACRIGIDDVDPALWLKVDSYSLLQALVHLAGKLVDEHDVSILRLRLVAASDRRAHLDLVWIGRGMSTETAIALETEPMTGGGEASALTVRDVVERHDGAFWFERERVRHEAFFRFLLPQAAAGEQLDASLSVHAEGRPEYYDFDLFAHSAASPVLDDRPLAGLSYTVFDTETTGLDPSKGDEIIQIGAVRIVGGKLRRQERFEQLVDPKRDIPAVSIAVHGIRPDMVAGQPAIKAVLPAFHAYAADTVLVAHNAAFDMRFLQLKEASCGVVFDQPVLDTLLLSAVLHPNQETHRLEEIAERFGLDVLGRHNALGDALVCAEVFLKMLPLLEAMGIRTLAQAREAAQKTYYARLKY